MWDGGCGVVGVGWWVWGGGCGVVGVGWWVWGGGCGMCISSLVVHVQLPKATETTALSGAGFMRLVKNVGQSISKIASKKSETDSVRGYWEKGEGLGSI